MNLYKLKIKTEGILIDPKTNKNGLVTYEYVVISQDTPEHPHSCYNTIMQIKPCDFFCRIITKQIKQKDDSSNCSEITKNPE